MPHVFGPFAELTRLQNELNRVFSALLEGGARPKGAFGHWDPPIDIVDSPESVRIFVETPGVPVESIRVSIRANRVTITGTKEPIATAPCERKFHCMERFFGPFEKSVTITQSINTHKGSAVLQGGVLTIEFPKVPDLRSREITLPVTDGERQDQEGEPERDEGQGQEQGQRQGQKDESPGRKGQRRERDRGEGRALPYGHETKKDREPAAATPRTRAPHEARTTSAASPTETRKKKPS